MEEACSVLDHNGRRLMRAESPVLKFVLAAVFANLVSRSIRMTVACPLTHQYLWSYNPKSAARVPSPRRL